MDAIDSKILEQMETEGFQKAAELAGTVRIGPDAIRRRVAHMIRSGTIRVIAIPNPVQLGYDAWADIGIHVITGCGDDVARTLARIPSVFYVARGFGEFDVYGAVLCRTIAELEEFANSELTRIPGVSRSEIIPTVAVRKYYRFTSKCRRTGSPDAAQPARSKGAPVHGPDETDWALIKALMKDGTLRPSRLHAMLGFGEKTIRRRVRSMLEQGLISLEVVFNPSVLRNRVSTLIGVRVNGEDAGKVADALADNPAIHSINLGLGRFNLVLGGRFDDIGRLSRFCSSELPAIHGVVSVHPFIVHRAFKYYGIDWTSEPGSDSPDESEWLVEALAERGR